MSADTITNFIEPTKDILADIKSKVEALDSINQVYILAGDVYNEIWRTLPLANPPLAVVTYEGSSYQDNPRRSYKFSVIVATRFLSSDEKAQNDTFDLIDDVIGAIDHFEYQNQCLYKVIGEKWLEYGNSGLTVYKIDFIAEDY